MRSRGNSETSCSRRCSSPPITDSLIAYASRMASAMTIDHTEIHEKLRGEGIGQDMIKAAVEYARANGLKIKADCPYAKKVIERTPEFQDVLK